MSWSVTTFMTTLSSRFNVFEVSDTRDCITPRFRLALFSSPWGPQQRAFVPAYQLGTQGTGEPRTPKWGPSGLRWRPVINPLESITHKAAIEAKGVEDAKERVPDVVAVKISGA